MARPHSLMLWSVVFAFLAAASLCAAQPKEPKGPREPKQKHAKSSVAKAESHEPDDPFGGAEAAKEEPVAAKKAAPHHGGGAVARPEKHPAPSAKKPPRPVVKALRPVENVARIEAALAGPTEVTFVEAPLTDVIDVLKAQHNIEIQIDTRALEDVGIGTDSPVTIDLKGISLRSVLNLILHKLNLTWIIADEVLIITTPEEAENRLDTKVYDVSDLVVCRDDHDALWDDYDALIDIITATIKPTSWEAVGGPGAVRGNALGTAKVLIVSQTQDVHEGIVSLLKGIREIAKKNPNAGTPRRNKPVAPTPKKYPANIGGLGSPPVYADPSAIPTPKTPVNTGKPAQEKQPPKPGMYPMPG
jgi:hypothetical protein